MATDVKCSFCKKERDKVNKLVAGPGVYICDECVGLCQEIISGSRWTERPGKLEIRYLSGESVVVDVDCYDLEPVLRSDVPPFVKITPDVVINTANIRDIVFWPNQTDG